MPFNILRGVSTAGKRRSIKKRLVINSYGHSDEQYRFQNRRVTMNKIGAVQKMRLYLWPNLEEQRADEAITF